MKRVLIPLLALVVAGCSTGCSAGAGSGPSTRTSSPAPGSAAGTGSSGAASSGSWVQQENARPGGTGWRIQHVAGPDELAGFASASSAAPGDKVTLRVTSTAHTWHVEAWRLGWYGGTGGRLVYRSGAQPAVRQAPVQVSAQHMVSAAHWTPGPTLDTSGWPAGSYLLKLVDDQGRQKYVPLTLRSSNFAGTVLMVSATSTYQAYNAYGGWSLYHGPTPKDPHATTVSFERPYDQDGARFAAGYERPLVQLAEKLGLDLSYATSTDLDQGQLHLDGLTGLVSPGHDEYWSVPMRTAVEKLRDAGTNLAFMGANASYWRVRFQAGGRQMVGYKTYPDPVSGDTATHLWRDLRPESTLTGQLYECFPVHGALVVRDPDFFGFAGTGATAGSSYPGLVGVEVDRAYPAPLAPPNLEVVAHSPVDCKGHATHSDMTWYAAASGAGVFASGSMDWRSGVDVVDPAGTPPRGMTAASVQLATAVTGNVLQAMATPRAGRLHPPRPNLSQLAPPASTDTGTGGAVRGRP